MLLVVLALAWVALLTPVALRKLRELNAERSIEHFHTEHEVLSRQGYTVEPAYRLAEPGYYVEPEHHVEPVRARVAPLTEVSRPRLTLVRDDDTYRSVESRRTWQEWSEDYDFERAEVRPAETANRYASAYSSVPREFDAREREEPALRPLRSMRRRRRVLITRLGLATVLVTGAAFVSGVSALFDLAVLSWLVDAAYLALALFSLSQGYLSEASVGLARRERLAPVSRLERPYRSEDDERDQGFGPGAYADAEYYEPVPEPQWERAAQARYALG